MPNKIAKKINILSTKINSSLVSHNIKKLKNVHLKFLYVISKINKIKVQLMIFFHSMLTKLKKVIVKWVQEAILPKNKKIVQKLIRELMLILIHNKWLFGKLQMMDLEKILKKDKKKYNIKIAKPVWCTVHHQYL